MIPYFYAERFPFHLDSYRIEPLAAQRVLTDQYNYLIIKAMCVLSHVIIGKWQDFIEDNSEIMMFSPEVYVGNVARMCQVVVDFTTDIYERFLSVCCLVIQTGEFACKDNGSVYYKLTPYILKVFYTKVLKDAFYKRGGWKRLERYLQSKDYINLKNRMDDAESDYEKSRLTTELAYYIKEKIKTLEYNPHDMFGKKMDDADYSIANDIIRNVIFSLEVPLFEELLNFSIIDKKNPLTCSLSESTASNTKSTLLLIPNNATGVGSGEIKILGLHEAPEATRMESVGESEANAHEKNLLLIKKLVDENISSNKSVSKNDTLHDVMKTLDQFRHKIEYLIFAFESLDSQIEEK
ncbi:hypothetical protein TNCT_594161 [Trichonephila clavata]|uniref:Uncharacterized protein n=1 Tax=Trichonephila clavata TaxID=2740835 RepID=A0A8X6L161_TRICU|nr:hypothetical protein TNCT_594161 [Trichonephila clavata]